MGGEPASKMTALPCRGDWELRGGAPYWNDRLVRDTFWDPRPSGFHGSVDISTSMRTRIRAREAGRIVQRGYDTYGFGRFTYLLGRSGHLYVDAHLDEIKVSDGERVRAGQVIGYSGNSGNSTGPHWHGEEWSDPGTRASRLDWRPRLISLLEGAEHMGLSAEQDKRLREIEAMLRKLTADGPTLAVHDQREAKRRDEILAALEETHGSTH